MPSISFTVPGDPVPQPRPRVSTVGGFARAYVPKDHPVHAYRLAVKLAAQAAGLTKTDAALTVLVFTVFRRPRSHLTANGVKASAPKLPRADVDNIAKAVLDALSEFFDDNNVQELRVNKRWSSAAIDENARTYVEVLYARD